MIGDNVNTIRNEAFKSSGITSIVLPRGVTALHSGVFAGCSSLTSLVMGIQTSQLYAGWASGAPLTRTAIPTRMCWSQGWTPGWTCGGCSGFGCCCASVCVCPTLTTVSIMSSNVNSCEAQVGDVVTLTLVASTSVGAPACYFGVHWARYFATGAGTDWQCSHTVTAADAAADGVRFTISGSVRTKSSTTDGSRLSSKTCVSFDSTHSPPFTTGLVLANASAEMACLLGIGCGE